MIFPRVYQFDFIYQNTCMNFITFTSSMLNCYNSVHFIMKFANFFCKQMSFSATP